MVKIAANKNIEKILPEHLTELPNSVKEVWEKLEKKELISPKYLKIQKKKILAQTKSQFEKNSKQPLKNVIIFNLKTLPDWLPATNLLKIAKMTTKEWTNLHNPKK